MANVISPLVSYTKISPNKSKRTQKIDTIIIHCMAGNLTAQRCADLFANKSRQASSNYCVDSRGVISCACPENYRSWCTSSAKADQRGVTIEVANDGGANTGWHVCGTALNALVVLIVDICKRNNIPKLVWSTNKNDRINHLNGCNMEVHRDHASKACPGDYLMSMHPWIVQQVNAQLQGNAVSPTTNTSANSKPATSTSKPTTSTTTTSNPAIAVVTDSGETKGKYKSGFYDYGTVFNPSHYAAYNTDLKTVFGTDAKKLFNHFITYGMKEGRKAIKGFDPKKYKEYNPDLSKTFGNTYTKYYQHYIKYGKKEGRRAI